jgi:RND superfamily putative drug exporter
MEILRDQAGAGALTPIEILAPRTATAAIARVMNRTFKDREAYITASGTKPPYVAGGWRRIYVIGRHEYGAEETQRLVRRIRSEYVPNDVRMYVTGAPAQGVDYLDRSYGPFPWLVGVALALTYLILLRAFRSLLLPLKAVILNILSVGATYGLLVVVFRWGVGHDLLGLAHVSQIEGWIPIFLFAMLFGLSMDYEVFLVTRMREAWDETHDNTLAVASGLERTGRIITAAALIMVAAFSGFLAGRIAGLQEFGAGLAFAILFDATLVRAVLVPALMAVLGKWNWYLPRGGSRSSLPSSTRST